MKKRKKKKTATDESVTPVNFVLCKNMMLHYINSGTVKGQPSQHYTVASCNMNYLFSNFPFGSGKALQKTHVSVPVFPRSTVFLKKYIHDSFNLVDIQNNFKIFPC